MSNKIKNVIIFCIVVVAGYSIATALLNNQEPIEVQECNQTIETVYIDHYGNTYDLVKEQ